MSVLRQLMQKEQSFPKWEQKKHFLCWCNTEHCRLVVVQKEVQETVTELDRTRLLYHTEESEAIRTATRAEEADLKAKGWTFLYQAVNCKFWPNKTNKCQMVQKEKKTK